MVIKPSMEYLILITESSLSKVVLMLGGDPIRNFCYVDFKNSDWLLQIFHQSESSKPALGNFKLKIILKGSDWLWLFHVSVTRLGKFWKFLATNFHSKVAQVFGDFFGYFWKSHILSKNWNGYFWVNFFSILANFYSNNLLHWSIGYCWRNIFALICFLLPIGSGIGAQTLI